MQWIEQKKVQTFSKALFHEFLPIKITTEVSKVLSNNIRRSKKHLKPEAHYLNVQKNFDIFCRPSAGYQQPQGNDT